MREEYEDDQSYMDDDMAEPSPRSMGRRSMQPLAGTTSQSGAPALAELHDLLPFMQSLPPPAAIKAPTPTVDGPSILSSTLPTMAGGDATTLLDSLTANALGALGNMTIDQFTQLLAKQAGGQAADAAWDPLTCLITPKIANTPLDASGKGLMAGLKTGTAVDGTSVALPPVPELQLHGTTTVM